MTELKTYLMRIQPTRTQMLVQGTQEEAEHVTAHFYRLKELTEQGIVLHAGRTTNSDRSSFGIVIFRAENDEAARAFVATDPAVANGVMKAELFPYGVALMAAPQSTDTTT